MTPCQNTLSFTARRMGVRIPGEIERGRHMDGAASIQTEDRMIDPAGWSEQHGEYLVRYAFRHVGEWHNAQDLVQETWLAVWQARARFAGQSSERTWLTGILRHKVIDHIRIASRERPLPGAQHHQLNETSRLNAHTGPASPQALWMDPARQLEMKQLRNQLDQCLCRLSERMKAVFAFCDLEEMPHRDVARRLGVTDGHLYVLLHRARQKVRECLSVQTVNLALLRQPRR